MGLDMRPMGKPKPGFEERFREIYEILTSNQTPDANHEELTQEWFANQIQTYETIKAPRIGRDQEADAWIRERYDELEEKPPLEDFLNEYEGYYVIELAKEQDGVPIYQAMNQDENVFRGEFLRECEDILDEDLINEAWETKLADETLDYGRRLMEVAERIAAENNLQYLKTERLPPDDDGTSLESKLHIVYSLAQWLIFYGKNGHGYEADF